MTDEEIMTAIAARLSAEGDNPSTIYVSPDTLAFFQRTEEQRKHWYWRAWWRVRYAPVDFLEWLSEKWKGMRNAE